ncbi:MAG: xanthine dehydrogenase family protein molybdopterin-binding subunit [Rubrivivax sp.]|nr:MAG: xanthine dehydrogenase family protein molybdopterin-binding subunit [Rubrivivax sp.]
MSAPASTSRRGFLASALVGGAWVLAAQPFSARAGTGTPLGMWLSIDGEGRVRVFTTVTQLGQGTHTAVAQVVAEELDLPLEAITVDQPMPPGITTFGSFGFKAALRTAGPAAAAARDMLLRAAAAQWQVPVTHCRLAQGAVLREPDGARLPFGTLLDAASRLAPPDPPVMRPRSQWRVLGRAVPRADIPARVDGSARFGIDVDMPGLLVAHVLHAPRFGATLRSVDARPARAVKGVVRVVELPGAVAVVASSYWTALQAARRLKPVWQLPATPALDTPLLRERLHDAVAAGNGLPWPEPAEQQAAATAQALQEAKHLIDVTYDLPFLAHAAMEPLSATVLVGPASAEVWVATQSQTDTQRAVAEALGLAPARVRLHSQDVGGGFGRRLEHDFAVEAALIARAVGRPVKTIWSRENDMQAGYYRPATASRVRLALDADCMPTALRHDTAGPSLLRYSGVSNGGPVQGFDWSYIMGWVDMAYPIAAKDTRWTEVDAGMPCGYWRSVGNSQNCFFLEHTLDQAAWRAGVDPLAYRRRLLAGHPRALAFLDAFAARAGWMRPLPPGHFRGFAMNSNGKTLFSAHIVEVEVLKAGEFRLVRIDAAIDPGVIGNPGQVEAQLMGGTLFGLTAALFGEITVRNGQVEQGNFDGYRLCTLADTPPLQVHLLPNGDAPEGVGEEGPPSIAPALANALFAASGQPINRLPLTRAGWALAASR